MAPKAAVAYAELQIVGYATKKGTFDGHGRTAAPGSGSGMTQTTMFSPQAQRKYIDVARRTLNLSRIEIVDAWFARIDRYTPATSLLSLRWKNANLSSASWAGAAAASFNSIFPDISTGSNVSPQIGRKRRVRRPFLFVLWLQLRNPELSTPNTFGVKTPSITAKYGGWDTPGFFLRGSCYTLVLSWVFDILRPTGRILYAQGLCQRQRGLARSSFVKSRTGRLTAESFLRLQLRPARSYGFNNLKYNNRSRHSR